MLFLSFDCAIGGSAFLRLKKETLNEKARIMSHLSTPQPSEEKISRAVRSGRRAWPNALEIENICFLVSLRKLGRYVALLVLLGQTNSRCGGGISRLDKKNVSKALFFCLFGVL